MPLAIRTNISAMISASQLSRTSKGLTGSLERISSGLRINKAADDAAGLGVATNLETQMMATRQAIRNTNDGISIIQTAEGATNEVTDILQRMRELAVQSSSETLDDSERSYIEDEFTQLSNEIARIAAGTGFNGIALADGVDTTLEVQVGINNVAAVDRITISLGDLTASGLGVDTGALSLSTSANAQTAIDAIDTALDSVNGFRSNLGSVQNRLDNALNNSQVYMESIEAARSNIQDADFAEETSTMTKMQIMQQAGVAALSQAKNINQSVTQLLQ